MGNFFVGQKVAVIYAVDPCICFPGKIIERLSGKWRVEDDQGNQIVVPDWGVFASREALEAAIPHLRLALDTTKNPPTLTEFPK